MANFKNLFNSIFFVFFKKKDNLFKKMLIFLVNSLVNGFVLAVPFHVFLGYNFDLWLIFGCGFGLRVLLDFFNEICLSLKMIVK